MRSTIVAALVSFAAELAYALPNEVPMPTQAFNDFLTGDGWTPMPTEGPSMELMKKRGYVEKRQAGALTSGQLVGFFAPNSLCGYISGSIGATLGCSSASRCAAVAPFGTAAGAVGCCPVGASGCFFITTCYNSAEISTKCDNGCQQDVNIKLCTAASAPFCLPYTWQDISATSYGCAAASASTRGTVSFLYVGETSTRSWSAYYYTPSVSGGSVTGSGAEILTVATSRANNTSTSTGGGGGGGGSGGGSSTNVGAIVGGVVGGVAVLCAIVFGIFFVLIRKKKQNKAAAANTHQPGAGVPPHGGVPGHSPGQMSAVPAGVAGAGAGAGAAGYYGNEYNKQHPHPPISELGSPVPSHASPSSGYMQPYKGDPNTPYDQRASHYSEAGSPVPPYHPSQNMPPIQQAPMELDSTTASPHVNPQGQPIYEAPADVPASHTAKN